MRLNLLINSTFLSLRITVDTLIDVENANKHITLLSDANVPVRFRAQQRAKYSPLQLEAYAESLTGQPHDRVQTESQELQTWTAVSTFLGLVSTV